MMDITKTGNTLNLKVQGQKYSKNLSHLTKRNHQHKNLQNLFNNNPRYDEIEQKYTGIEFFLRGEKSIQNSDLGFRSSKITLNYSIYTNCSLMESDRFSSMVWCAITQYHCPICLSFHPSFPSKNGS